METRTKRMVVSTPRAPDSRRASELALARHLTVEYYDCDPRLLADANFMERALVKSAHDGKATVIESRFHTFEPQGVSGVVIIAESHFSVHTWPEHDYAAVDFFTCSHDLDFDAAEQSLRKSLAAGGMIVSADLYRGIPWNNGTERIIPTTKGRPRRFVLSWKDQYEEAKAWGLSTSVDVYHCEPAAIRDAEKIREFVRQLCDKLEMKRFGECQVVDFGEEERVAGFSMTQLIETSLISGHFANASNAAYLDIFSCKYFEPRVMAEFATSYFGGRNYRMQVSLRR